MKRYRVGLGMLVLLLALILVACGGENGGDSDESSGNIAATPTVLTSDNPTTYTTLDVNAAYDQFQGDSDAVIVDVRNPEEWQMTGIPVGAALIPLPEFEQRAPNELPKDQTIYVICNSGNRSRVAADILITQGYTNVVNIDGGIQAWLREGLPTEAYTP